LAYAKPSNWSRDLPAFGITLVFSIEDTQRTADAEAAFRKAIELDPMSGGSWDNLGDLLAEAPERTADAEAAYREAIALDRVMPAPAMILAISLKDPWTKRRSRGGLP